MSLRLTGHCLFSLKWKADMLTIWEMLYFLARTSLGLGKEMKQTPESIIYLKR